jgi:uncharacterized protein YjbJ (UPF0337 family)
MNREQLMGKWNQVKGSIRKRWGKLTDDDMEKIAGHRDSLIGKIQEKYGKTKEEAEKEVDDFTTKH